MNQICDNCDKLFDRICFCSAACRIKFNNRLRRKVKKEKLPTIQLEPKHPVVHTPEVKPITTKESWEDIKKNASFL